MACLLRLDAAVRAKPRNWRAAAWLLERFAPERYGRRRFVDGSGMVPIAEVKGFLHAMVGVLECWVPEERREAELDNLIAVGEQIAARGPHPLRRLQER